MCVLKAKTSSRKPYVCKSDEWSWETAWAGSEPTSRRTVTDQLRNVKASCLVFLAMFLTCAAGFGQVAPTGTISGVVKDPSGLLLPKANVTVINVAQNLP